MSVKILEVKASEYVEDNSSSHRLAQINKHLQDGWKLLAVTTSPLERTSSRFDTYHFYHLFKPDPTGLAKE